LKVKMKKLSAVLVALTALLAGGASRVVQDQCGPFTDVTPGFCPFILEIYYLGITVGTSATTFSPDDPLTRGQGAVFVAKGINQTLARSSRRAALGQWWATGSEGVLGSLLLPGLAADLLQADGQDIWVAQSDSVQRVRASDSRLLETWTGALGAYGIQVAMGRVFATSLQNYLYMIDPTQPAGDVAIVADSLGSGSGSIAFDGSRLWTANVDSVSIVTPGSTTPWSVSTVATGFNRPVAVLFDGTNIWISDLFADSLLRLDSLGSVIQTVPVGHFPNQLTFDGANIWVPNSGSDTVTIVAASTGSVLTTLAGNGMSGPLWTAFDGERVLVVGAHSVSLWRAADLRPLGSFTLDASDNTDGVCSDGVHFWITVNPVHKLLRF